MTNRQCWWQFHQEHSFHQKGSFRSDLKGKKVNRVIAKAWNAWNSSIRSCPTVQVWKTDITGTMVRMISLLKCEVSVDTEWSTANNRSSHRRCSIKSVVLKNFAKFTGKQLCLIGCKKYSFFRGLQLHYKWDSGTGALLWISRNFYRASFLQKTSGRLLL